MRRLRIALAALLLALAIPVALLVGRALRSVEIEERVRHEALAERIFDEMERTLSDFLAREEARAPGEYRFYRGRDGLRSPLSRPAAEPFVIGHFEIDPSGTLRTPLRPRDPDAAARAGDWPPPPGDDARIEEAVAFLEREVAPFWRDAEARLAAAREADARDADGLERSIAKAAPGPAAERPKTTAEAPPPGDDEQLGAYELLQSLNVGARKRAARREQVELAEPDEGNGSFGRSVAESESPVLSESMADAPSASAPTPYASARPSRMGRIALDRVEEEQAGSPYAPRAAASPSRARMDRPAPRRVVLEPMAGLPIGERHWMLYRTVLVDGQGYRQGLLIDLESLGRWLADQVIGDGRLAAVARVHFGAGLEPPDGGEGYRVAHRFVEPFSGLDADLRVGPLPDTGNATVMLLLAGLLAGVAVLGVLAVHRMVSVVVEFAERRSNFVAAVSHELKTPLTAIRMYGEMLRDGLVPAEESRDTYYRTITDESERLSRLIDNVLEFSRLERGGRLLATTVGSPAPVVRDVVEHLRPHAERAGFTLALDVDEAIPAVRFDRDALAQILFNLVDNAVKYAGHADRKEIVVRCRATPEGGAMLSVRDYGPGVPREHLARIFEPFYRVEEELTRSTRGSGIGLSLVEQLGDAMGASITGTNAAGGGLQVQVTLPPTRG